MRRMSDGYLESWLFNFDYQRVEFLTGGLQTEVFFLRPLELENRTGDSFAAVVSESTEVLVEPFEISPGIIVPPGKYDVDTRGLTASTGNHRKISANMRFVQRQFLRRQPQ